MSVRRNSIRQAEAAIQGVGSRFREALGHRGKSFRRKRLPTPSRRPPFRFPDEQKFPSYLPNSRSTAAPMSRLAIRCSPTSIALTPADCNWTASSRL
jgi:hypothetical protein